MYKLPANLNIGAESNMFRGDRLTPFLKAQVVHEPKTSKIHDANDNTLRILDCIKLFVHVDRMTELVIFLVCKRLAVSAILGCDFCD